MFSKKLLYWYSENKRDLPWRRTKDPYLIWLSEIIMQQTRIEQGTPYFNRFAAAFPNVKVPFRDSVQALAYRVAYDFAAARVQSGGANDLLANYQACVDGIVQRQVRRMQHVIYERDAYGSPGDVFGWFG